MKRDMNLIRLLLLEVEGEEPRPDLSGYTEEQKACHMALLIEAKLVHGGIVPNETGYPVAARATHLTWAGHEFLDAARNENIWHQAVDKIKKAGVTVGLPILQQL